MSEAVGTFEVKMKPEALSEVATETGLSRMSIDKVFAGQLDGVSRGEFLAMGNPSGSAGYVAMEKFTGTLEGREGSFALQHTGLMMRGVPELKVAVVPDSGTGELAGISGEMKIDRVEKVHHYEFRYEFQG